MWGGGYERKTKNGQEIAVTAQTPTAATTEM